METSHLACIGVYAGLLVAASVYTYILSRPNVRTWYASHNLTDITVVLGNSLIILGGAGLAAVGAIPWSAAGLFAILFVVAGLPILIWQRSDAFGQRTSRETYKKCRDKNGETSNSCKGT